MIRAIFKWVGIAAVAVALCLSGVYLWMARDRGPTHPSLAAADQAPLIPVRDIWANRDSSGATRSRPARAGCPGVPSIWPRR